MTINVFIICIIKMSKTVILKLVIRMVKLEYNQTNLGLVFIKFENNPTNFLSRVFQVSKPDIAHIKLPYIVKRFFK